MTTKVARVEPQELIQWGESSDSERQCIGCRFKGRKDSFISWIFICSKLGHWTYRDFTCDLFKPRNQYCVYEMDETEYRHLKNCKRCLKDPETCPRSSHYNPDWDWEKGEWREKC